MNSETMSHSDNLNDKTNERSVNKSSGIIAEQLPLIFTLRTTALVFFIAVFATFTHWGVWSKLVYAIGWNSTLFCLANMSLVLYLNKIMTVSKNWPGLVPFFLIIVSYTLFENPWLKTISLIIFPVLLSAYITICHIEDEKQIVWDSEFITCILARIFRPINFISEAFRHCLGIVSGSKVSTNNILFKRMLKGVLLLIPAAIIVVTLLSSVDNNFYLLIQTISHTFLVYINFSFVGKIIFSMVLLLILLAALHVSRLKESYSGNTRNTKLDDVVVSIFMGGLLFIYCIYIFVQFEYLVVNELPINFGEAEYLVKSGFWQLLFLSVLNVVLFTSIYKNTAQFGQIVLRAFVIASWFIVLSACWRLILYISSYGLSYEKYFASYTVFYILCVFIFLLWATFSKNKKNILRMIWFSSLWLYALATITPVEKIIYNTNLYLSLEGNTQVDTNQLKNLSVDILSNVENDIEKGKLSLRDWSNWLYVIDKQQCQNSWYELNLSRLLNCPKL